jgi:nucleotide-binding universal stress UspA family protein
MFKRILVPLDGSGRAERALPIAARLARAAGGSIVLVRVLTYLAKTSSTHFCSQRWPMRPLVWSS